jgi:hypothetical protein
MTTKKRPARGKGALRANLHIPAGKKIPIGKLVEALESGDPIIRRQAREALNFARARAKKPKRAS